MSKLTQSPASLIKIFTNLCLSQVIEQLNENVSHFVANPESFVMDGELFIIAPNKTFILDDSLTEYGIQLNFSRTLN